LEINFFGNLQPFMSGTNAVADAWEDDWEAAADV
jgi:hypothetical protein